jgi:hypothetical protein
VSAADSVEDTSSVPVAKPKKEKSAFALLEALNGVAVRPISESSKRVEAMELDLKNVQTRVEEQNHKLEEQNHKLDVISTRLLQLSQSLAGFTRAGNHE